MDEQQTKIEYNLKDDLLIVPDEIEAGIIKIEESTAEKVYGEKAKDPKQEVLILRVENNEFKVNAEIPITKYDKGKVSSKSKLGKILKKYGSIKVGQVVRLKQNDKDFWEIIV